MTTYIWNGIYKSLDEIKDSRKSTLETNEWVEMETTKFLKHNKNINAFLNNNIEDNDVVMDFGGSLALSYFTINKKVKKYIVVETQKICERRKELLKDSGVVEFYSDIPKIKINKFFVKSALQYSENYQVALQKVIDLCNPEKMIFQDFAAGSIKETYLTLQTWKDDTQIPYLFIRLGDIYSFLRNNEYMPTSFSDSIRYFTYDQNNFPEEYRIRNSCDVVFEKENK